MDEPHPVSTEHLLKGNANHVVPTRADMEDLSLGIRHPWDLPAELDRVLEELLAVLGFHTERPLPVFTGSRASWGKNCVTVPADAIRPPEHPTASGMHVPEDTDHQQKSCFH
jgi:hypothetical protein